jgi:hypothetical protein
LVTTDLDEAEVFLIGHVRVRRIVLQASIEHSRPLAKGSQSPDPTRREATLSRDQS